MSRSISLASNAHLALIKTHRFRSLHEHQKELLAEELKRRRLNSLEIAALSSETEAFALYEDQIEVCSQCNQKKINRNQAGKLGLTDFFKDEAHCIFCNKNFHQKKARKKNSISNFFNFFVKPFSKTRS